MTNTYPKLRSDLIVSSDSVDESIVYTVKEPITGRFFRLRAPEYYLLTRADGQTSPQEAAKLTSEHFGIQIPATAAAAFYAKMERLLFFEGPALERERKRLGRIATAGHEKSIWSIRLKAIDPDAFLSRWQTRLAFLFHPVSVGFGFFIMALALMVAVGQSSIWIDSLTSLWSVTTIPLLIAGILVVGFVHELGHAFTLKHFGGSVREMGFLLLYFQPCFYCNLSDSYLLKTRRQQLLVGASGLFFQGVLTALFILLWRLTTPGTIVADFLYVAVAFSLAVYLFNFNPLIRLDGYYLLADWLRLPNLRARAFDFWKRVIAEWTTGRVAPDKPRRERIIYGLYGILASVYTGVLIGWLLFHVTVFLHGHLGPAGIVIVYGAVLAFALRTQSDTSEETASTADGDAETSAARRYKKPLILWGGLIVIILLLILVKMERRVGSYCEVEPSARLTVYSSTSGMLETEYVDSRRGIRERSLLLAISADFSSVKYKIYPTEGDSVAAGDTVIALESNLFLANLLEAQNDRARTVAERNLLLSGPKEDQVKVVRAEIDEIKAQLENQQSDVRRADQLREQNLISEEQYSAIRTELKTLEARLAAKESELRFLISDPKAEELAIKDAQIEGLDARISFLQSQIEASVVHSPIDGIVSRVGRGDVLVEVARTDPVRVELHIDEDDIVDVETGDPVTLKVRPLPFKEFNGTVTQMAIDADTLDAKPRFKVITEIANPDFILKPGMTGYAKVACGKRSLLYLITRRLVHFIRVEFWSWW
ncbi:MAG: hemolysin D [Candidatus Zixiibacteriota bacterium]